MSMNLFGYGTFLYSFLELEPWCCKARFVLLCGLAMRVVLQLHVDLCFLVTEALLAWLCFQVGAGAGHLFLDFPVARFSRSHWDFDSPFLLLRQVRVKCLNASETRLRLSGVQRILHCVLDRVDFRILIGQIGAVALARGHVSGFRSDLLKFGSDLVVRFVLHVARPHRDRVGTLQAAAGDLSQR